jgi:hypothetical protein
MASVVGGMQGMCGGGRGGRNSLVVRGEPKDWLAARNSGNRYPLSSKLNCFSLPESPTFALTSYIPLPISHYLYCVYQ